MKKVLMALGFLLGVGSGIGLMNRSFDKESKLQFTQLIQFQRNGYDFCSGNIRNYVAFGYYQVDNVKCEYMNEKGSFTDTPGPLLLSEIDLKEVWWKSYWSPTDSYTYSPVLGNGMVPENKACEKPLDNGRFQDVCAYKMFVRDGEKWMEAAVK